MTQEALDRYIQTVIPNTDAAAMLSTMSRLVRLVDDVADGDAAHPQEAMAEIMELALIRLPSNPFYATNAGTFAPMLVTIHAIWSQTDDMKTSEHQNRIAWGYIWRDGIDMMLYHVALLVGGVAHAMRVVSEFRDLSLQPGSETIQEWEQS